MPKNFDFTHAPFDRLTPPQRDKLRASLDIAYYRAGETLFAAGEQPDHLQVVIKGLVADLDGDDVVTVHGAWDVVGAEALFGGRVKAEDGTPAVPTFAAQAQEETLAYMIPRQLVFELCRDNPAFQTWFTQSLGDRLAERVALESTRGMASFLVAKVDQAYLHPPLFVDEACTLKEAALRMKAEKASSLLVRRADGAVGVLTGTDLRDAVLVDDLPPSTPVGGRATFGVVTVEHDNFLFDAQVLMQRYGVRRLPVTRYGKIIGLLELTDLLATLSSQSHLVVTRVDRAQSIDDLRAASEAMTPLLQALHGSGVKVRHIAELVTDLSRKIQRKLFTFLAPPALQADACLIVMGSEGRGEQIAKTDQDNALILRDGVDPDSARAFARAYTEAMIAFGYPPCPGGMMVSNPAWCKTASAFADDIFDWVVTPSEAAFLNLAAFMDAEAVAGDPLLLARLRQNLNERLNGNQGFMAHFARPILSFDTPIGFFHQILTDKGARKGEIDIKKGGIFPIVHGVRALALEKRLPPTNTLDRIDALSGGEVLDAAFAADLAEALQCLMELRLHARLSKGAVDGEGSDNYVRAEGLTKLQHDALKDSLLIVKQFKDMVSHHFHLGAF